MAITVTTPASGAKWKKGTTQEIIWTDTVPEAFVHIELWKGGIFDSLIKGKQAGTPQTYDWPIPGGQTSGDDYQVKVEEWATGSPNDLSDNFSIFEDFSRSLSDTVGLADSGTDARGIKTVQSDSLSLADVLIRLKIFGLSDTVSLSDSDLFSLIKVLSENVSLSDIDIFTLLRPLSESLSLSDTILRNRSTPLSDTVSLSDSDLLSLVKVLTESISISDIIAILWNRPLSDSISLSDSILRGKTRSLSDTISLSDSDLFSLVKILSESVSISDAIKRALTIPASESISISDSLTGSVSKVRAAKNTFFYDSVGLTDSTITEGYISAGNFTGTSANTNLTRMIDQSIGSNTNFTGTIQSGIRFALSSQSTITFFAYNLPESVFGNNIKLYGSNTAGSGYVEIVSSSSAPPGWTIEQFNSVTYQYYVFQVEAAVIDVDVSEFVIGEEWNFISPDDEEFTIGKFAGSDLSHPYNQGYTFSHKRSDLRTFWKWNWTYINESHKDDAMTLISSVESSRKKFVFSDENSNYFWTRLKANSLKINKVGYQIYNTNLNLEEQLQ